MKKPLRYEELRAVAASSPRIENFGPNSENLYVAFELERSHPELIPWLKELPCPVIGIGRGSLSPGCDVILSDDKELQTLTKNISLAPLAAMVLVQHLRVSEGQSLQDALKAESFAYATLQKGPEFLAWQEGYSRRPLQLANDPAVDVVRDDTSLFLSLNQPKNRNAMGTMMRDTLCEILDIALMDKDISKVTLTGKGATFSIGGAIEEFGEVSDPATAHWIRSLRLPATRLAQLTDKLEIHVNGAAIGAGAEIAAFGHRVTSSSKAWFQLPELKYGLIPGAGGTASIPRRIGRQKTAYMALCMKKIRAKTALEWGLIDAIID